MSPPGLISAFSYNITPRDLTSPEGDKIRNKQYTIHITIIIIIITQSPSVTI